MFGLMLSGGTVAALVIAGLVLRNRQIENGKKIYSAALAVSSILVLSGALIALFSGTSVAAEEAVAVAKEISVGAGLGFIGAAAATAIACVGAGIAVANVGSAAMGLVGEKPEMLGTTLIYLGLAEGIAIYGVIVSLLIIQKL
ncbi:ATP synthase subunit C [Cloacibacillus sp. An23]|uniref:ATP synthase subunit C n=1 Tax=Cloacibacillus sp. An23 TaxID=1965591 RepID=UPI000B3A6ED6|nr:ATP synthase subunit C [Cloacibacillus sp. An23]OUO93701.1 ATPase [Cloacibacillus sp. An23]